jgi:hypothetical protein
VRIRAGQTGSISGGLTATTSGYTLTGYDASVKGSIIFNNVGNYPDLYGGGSIALRVTIAPGSTGAGDLAGQTYYRPKNAINNNKPVGAGLAQLNIDVTQTYDSCVPDSNHISGYRPFSWTDTKQQTIFRFTMGRYSGGVFTEQVVEQWTMFLFDADYDASPSNGGEAIHHY